ncbi:hypothetical protein [Streptomyces californicus]|uniref:hypothetical protein n=1 Tax=Streptomyces californicus TaxID=67351 RepID=UPI0035E1679E
MNTLPVSQIVKAHKLSEPMLRALYTGEDGASVFCDARTERALIARELIHPVQSTLTPKGLGVVTALRGRGPRLARSAADLPEGTRVSGPDGRTGTALGCWTGRVANETHPNFGREYTGVQWDPDTRCPWGERGRWFVDELTVIGGAS